MIDSTTRTHYYDFGSFRLNVSNRLLMRNGEHIPLTQKSFEILCFLIRNRNRILRKQEILDEVWSESYVEEANLAQHVYMVRKALKDSGSSSEFIETVPKFGYRFTGEVKESFADAVLNTPTASFASVSDSTTAIPALVAPYKTFTEETLPGSQLFTGARLATAAAAALLAAVLVSFLFNYQNFNQVKDLAEVKSISILPFRQIGGEKDEKLGLGLADTLISRLGGKGSFEVTPTSAIERFSNSTSSPIEIGSELGVDAVLTGTIQKDGDRVRINVQMISVSRKIPIWTDKFDENFSDIFSLQDRISGELAGKLNDSFGKTEQIPIAFAETRNPEARNAYEKGVYFWKKRTEDDLKTAIGHLEEAVRLDPQFAKAEALLADCLSLAAIYGIDSISPEQAIAKAKISADKAIKLDPSTSQAYSALAVVAQYEKDAGRAADLLKKAVALDPRNAVAHLRLAWIHAVDENLNEAIAEMKLARDADPESQVIALNLARLLRLDRQTDEALKVGKRAVELDPAMMWTRLILAEIYEQKGMFDESIEELRAVPKSAPEQKTARLLISRVLAKKGDKTEARKILKDLAKTEADDAPSYEVASVLAQLGNKREAFRELRRGNDESLIGFLQLKYDYNLDPLRDNPEYKGLVSQSRMKFMSSYDRNS